MKKMKNNNNEESRAKMYLRKILRLMAILVLKKYNPRIVSVTGSVGKTSTKEAIFIVLASQFRVRRNEKNYNNEIGIPLTIIGADSGKSSFFGWMKVFFKWLKVVSLPLEYPEILVLEMGADRPGDIEYLTGFVRSEVGVVTDVSYSHIEFFGSLESVAKEKGALVRELEENGLAVLSTDNPYVYKMRNDAKSQTITFGFSEEADLRAEGASFVYDSDEKIKGLSFKLNYKGTSIPVRLNNILSKHHIYSALAASAVGTWFGLNLVEIGTALENFALPYGRMNLINGIKGTMIIDDTYNSSPTSALAALSAIGEIKASRKIVIFGDMLELGGETERRHAELGKKFLEIKGDIFFGVGKRMKFAIAEMEKHGFERNKVFWFENPAEAGKKVQEIIQNGDLVLVKGSQGMRMEKVVEEIMAKPLKAPELLCRQDAEWRGIPFRSI